MIIKTTVMISFKLPEEYTSAINFEVNNNSQKEWCQQTDTQYITFHKTEMFYADCQNNEVNE